MPDRRGATSLIVALALAALTTALAAPLDQQRGGGGGTGTGGGQRGGTGIGGQPPRGSNPRGMNPGRRGGPGSATAARIETRVYPFRDTNEQIEYSIFVSTKVKKDKPAPLVIALHGLGVPPAGMLRFLTDEAEKRGYILAAPMGYNLRGWYGITGPGTGDDAIPNLAELSEKDVMNVLDRMRVDFTIDERPIYLLGQSMGGAGALHLGVKHARVWAAVGATAPALRPSQSPASLETIARMPVILIHGDADAAVPVTQSRTWAAKMKELAMTYEYRELAGGSHPAAIADGAKHVFAFFDKHMKSPRE